MPATTQANRRRRALAPLDLKQRYAINEAAEYLRICRAQVYNKVSEGTLRVIHDGRRTFVPGSEIARVSGLE